MLHFVEQFFRDPEESARVIAASHGNKKAANLDWDGEQLQNRRQLMHDLLVRLHKEWRPWRDEQEQKEAEAKREHRERKRAKREAEAESSGAASDGGAKQRDVEQENQESQTEPPSRPPSALGRQIYEIEDDDDSSALGSPEKTHSRLLGDPEALVEGKAEPMDVDPPEQEEVAHQAQHPDRAQQHPPPRLQPRPPSVSPTPERASKRSRSAGPPSPTVQHRPLASSGPNGAAPAHYDSQRSIKRVKTEAVPASAEVAPLQCVRWCCGVGAFADPLCFLSALQRA